jgi:REP element-mobilizing transposase RayT
LDREFLSDREFPNSLFREIEVISMHKTNNRTSQKTNVAKYKGWHSRGYIPHYDRPGVEQVITIRIKDSLPSTMLEKYDDQLAKLSGTDRCRFFDRQLDKSYGACYLKDPEIAGVVEETILHFENERYDLFAYVIMSNHVHVLLRTIPGFEIGKIVRSWKTFTARKANKILDRNGEFWARDYFDRYIRDSQHFEKAVWYIHNNPVKAGLVADAMDWAFSSARELNGKLPVVDNPGW